MLKSILKTILMGWLAKRFMGRSSRPMPRGREAYRR